MRIFPGPKSRIRQEPSVYTFMVENVPIGEKPESSNIWVTEMQLCVAIIRFDFCR